MCPYEIREDTLQSDICTYCLNPQDHVGCDFKSLKVFKEVSGFRRSMLIATEPESNKGLGKKGQLALSYSCSKLAFSGYPWILWRSLLQQPCTRGRSQATWTGFSSLRESKVSSRNPSRGNLAKPFERKPSHLYMLNIPRFPLEGMFNM